MNVILLYNDHRRVSDTHVAFYRVVRKRIRMCLWCVGITPQVNVTQFCLEFRLNGTTAVSMKY